MKKVSKFCLCVNAKFRNFYFNSLNCASPKFDLGFRNKKKKKKKIEQNNIFIIIESKTVKEIMQETPHFDFMVSLVGYVLWLYLFLYHYGNTLIQIYWKFHHQKLKVFR